MFESIFLNPAGLATALVLIPFLLFYLIRPKPRHETVPSLLFVMKDMGKSNIDSLFRSLLKDLLILFHLLILLLLVAAAAKPYLNVPKSYLVQQTVVLVDVSGSMRAEGDARFDAAVKAAQAVLGKENTIILIKANPDILVERVSASRASDALERLRPTETATDLSGALQLASQYATIGTRIVVVSDFLATAGDLEFETQADALEALGAIVEYVPVTSSSRNVGIIDLAVGPITSSVWVKNYDDRPEQVTLAISDATQQVLLAKGETKEVTFKTPPGVAQVTIKEGDDLEADNVAWTSTPEKTQVRVLIITNDRAKIEKMNLLLALGVISKNFPTTFDIEYAIPPKIPDLNHDVYLIADANLDFILPGYVKNLREKVERGAALVYFAQPGLFALDWQGLLPVDAANDTQGGRETISAPETNVLTQDIDFGQTGSYTRVTARDGATVIAAAGQRDPVLVLDRRGKGHVLYYGLDDSKASFSKDPSYPVFWRRSFDLLTNRPSLENLNVHTGTILALPNTATIKTPDGKVTTNLLALDHEGLYTLSDRTIAANMLSDAESRIASTNTTQGSARSSGDAAKDKAPKDVTDWILWAAIALVFLELLYVKYRGDF